MRLLGCWMLLPQIVAEFGGFLKKNLEIFVPGISVSFVFFVSLSVFWFVRTSLFRNLCFSLFIFVYVCVF